MNRLMADELFNAQLLRTLGAAAYQGAGVGEFLATASRIPGTDLDAWHDEWKATGARLLAVGRASEAQGANESARSAFLQASSAFRTAGVFALGAPLDARLVETHRLEVESFRAGTALLAVPPEVIEIPYDGATMPGYLFRPADDDERRPTVILVTGYDGTAEELYFANGAAALERGYNVITFDGPGQGTMIINRGIPLRPDWEHVITPVVDFALARACADPDRIAVIGLSLGGYLAPRAATKERRLAACVSDCGPYDVFDATVRRMPGWLARHVPDGNPIALWLLDRILAKVIAKPTAGWALRRNVLVHGLDDPRGYFRIASDYSLKGLEHEIRCPTFVCSAEDDDLSVDASTLHAALTCPKVYHEFKTADGAGDHCEGAGRVHFHQVAFDWLDDVLSQHADPAWLAEGGRCSPHPC